MTRSPEAEYLPGADVHLNASRWQGVRVVIIHEPQGGCEGIVNLGRTRHHSTPGTYNGVDCRSGRRVQFYDDEVRCSHAAGANSSGPGWECSDFTPSPLRPSYSDECLRSLGREIMRYHRVHGVPLVYYANESGSTAGRIWVDRSGVRGFLAHRAVDYPPNRSFLHYDGPTTAEFARAVQLAGGAPGTTPGPIPSPTRRQAVGQSIFHAGHELCAYVPATGDRAGALWVVYDNGAGSRGKVEFYPPGYCARGDLEDVTITPGPGTTYWVSALDANGQQRHHAYWDGARAHRWADAPLTVVPVPVP